MLPRIGIVISAHILMSSCYHMANSLILINTSLYDEQRAHENSVGSFDEDSVLNISKGDLFNDTI